MSSPVSLESDSLRREAALRFLYARINYERTSTIPYRAREFKLDRMRRLLDRLGNPQNDLPIVHVAGTKGKGSTATMVGAVLQAAGYRTGVYTSPHLDRVEERLAIDSQPCSPAELAELVERVAPQVEAIEREAASSDGGRAGPTYFEITTAMALVHFASRKVDAAVLEVGLGGRLDSTNVCRPLVSVITSISLDHTKQLGTTLAAIAREKAGIIKPNVPVVSGVDANQPRRVVRQVCRRRGSPLAQIGADFHYIYHPPHDLQDRTAPARIDFRYGANAQHRRYDDLALGLLGRHQAANAAVALAVLERLRRQGHEIPEPAIRHGLAQVACPARVELLARHPAVVVDAAHNPASIEALIQTLQESFSPRRSILVFATTQEKDVAGMLRRLVGRFDRIVLTRYLNNPRAVPPEQLATIARSISPQHLPVYDRPDDAWRAARRLAGPDDLICVTGSFFIASELRRRVLADPPPDPIE